MAEVGSAFVSVVPSARGFGKKLSKDVEPQTKSVGKSIGSTLGKAFAITGGAVAAVGFLKGSIDEAREAQKVGALTESTIRATGGAANVSAKQVGNLATALSLKTGIDDEVIQSGENMLLTFKNIRNEAGKGNDIFNQSTKVLTDMSAALGVEPKKAAIQLGKALNDPIKGVSALSRVGVTFTEKQKNVIKSLVKTGDTAAAQKVILKELNSEFGGAAEAQATAGDKARVAMGNLQETIGTALLPVIDKMANTFSGKVAPAISTFVTGMQDGTGAGGELVDTAQDIGHALKPVADLAIGTGKALGHLPGPIKSLAVEAAIAALVFPRLSRGIGGIVSTVTSVGPRLRTFTADMQNVEKRAVAVDKVVSGIKMGAGVAGFTLLADGARRSGGALKELETIGGAALTGFAVGGPIGAAVMGGGTALFRLADAGAEAGRKVEAGRAGIGSIISTLDKVTGAATTASRALAFNTVEKQGGFATLAKAKAAYSGLTVTARDLVDASMGNVDAQRRVAAGFAKANNAAQAKARTDRSAYGAAKDLQAATGTLNKALGVNSKDFAKAGDKARQMHQAVTPLKKLLGEGVRSAAKAAGGAVAAFSGEVKRTPKAHKTTIEAETSKARGQVSSFINGLPDNYTIHLAVQASVHAAVSAGIGKNAAGTDFWRGGPTWVGERGPEIVNLPRGARVTPNDELRGGGGRQAITITNWKTGEGYMETVADSRVGAHVRLRNESARARR